MYVVFYFFKTKDEKALQNKLLLGNDEIVVIINNTILKSLSSAVRKNN